MLEAEPRVGCSKCAGIGKTFYEVEVVGDFCAEEARQYYEKLKGSVCEDDDWQQVYEVSNGAPEWLLSCTFGMMDRTQFIVRMCQA